MVYESRESQVVQSRHIQHLDSHLDTEKIVAALESVLPRKRRPLPLHEPWFDGNEWSYVKDCLETGWVSSGGSYVGRLELLLSEFTGSKCAVATVNETAALYICLKLISVEPGDEVWGPEVPGVATANAVSYC